MKRLLNLRSFALASAWVLTNLPMTASACSACMGNPNSKTAGAANGAIFLMLGLVGTMLGLVGVFAFTLMRRAQNPQDPELTALMTAQEVSK